MFRYDVDDEPLRYAPRTLIAIITMKGATPRSEKKEEKVGTMIIGLYLCKCKKKIYSQLKPYRDAK